MKSNKSSPRRTTTEFEKEEEEVNENEDWEYISEAQPIENLNLEFKFMSQKVRQKLKHSDYILKKECQTDFASDNTYYFNLINKLREETSTSSALRDAVVDQAFPHTIRRNNQPT